MAEKVVANPAPKPAHVGVRDMFDAKATVQSTHTPELVIALCGPIGSPLHPVAETIGRSLETEFGYEKCTIIRLSDFIDKYKGPVKAPNEFDRIEKLISLGDEFRKQYGANILAQLAISQIALDRQKKKDADSSQRYEPRRVCHIVDSVKNQEELEILKSIYRDMLYFVGVFAPLPSRQKALEKRGMTPAEVYKLIDRDSGEELAHGMTVRDTFPQADFFLRISSNTDTATRARVERFLHLILGTKVLTPSYAETAMYAASSSAGNSACLSRQVGAALTDPHGEIISVGWNDVPKANGGLYMYDPERDAAGDRDKRCWNLDGGVCFNDREKSTIAELLVEQLKTDDLIDAANKAQAVESVLKNTKVKDLIEFSRAIHAEMHAILSAGQLNGGRVRGGKLYCTTYPCHACARHIIAAGISEVYYIEPYRKSLATKLHDDAITENETDTSKVRILPYDGVAPSRYLTLFRVPKDSRKLGGKMTVVNPKTASPRFDKTLEALPTLEAVVVKEVTDKNLLPREANNG